MNKISCTEWIKLSVSYSMCLFKLLARKINWSTLCGLIEFRLLRTTLPPILNTLSDGTLIAHRDKYLRAAEDSSGMQLASKLHHFRGDSSISKMGYYKYISTSRRILSDKVSECELLLRVVVLPNNELNFPFLFLVMGSLLSVSFRP